MKNKIIPYNPKLKELARQLRKNSTFSEVRQVPLLDYIVDFYCHELQLSIEIDGKSHEFKYDKDAQRERHLEKVDVHLIRLQDSEVKNNMFSVLLTLQQIVSEMQKENPDIGNEKTPLRSPQGDTQRLTFSKKERLKNRKLFETLFSEGKSLREFPLKLIYVKTSAEQDVPVKVAVVAPKKKFKRAVDRNRVKRLLREAYRLNKPLIFNNIEGNFAFIFLYLGNTIPSYDEVDRAMKQLLAAFLKKESHEKNP